MADLVTRLLLNSSQFDDNIKKSTQQVQQFQAAGKNITATIGKFAGALGVAMTVGEAFNKVLNSSQTLGDMTASNMAALKTSVDEFFWAIGSGNFSSFLNGLGDIVTKAKEAYAAMDQLGNTQMSYNVFSAKNQAEIAEAQYTATNKFAPANERVEAFASWRQALESQETNTQILQQDILEAATTAVEEKSVKYLEVTLEDMLKAFAVDLQPENRGTAREKAKYIFDAHQVYSSQKYRTEDEIKADVEARKQYLVNYTMLEKYNDEELNAIAQKIQQYYQLTTAVSSLGRAYNLAANKFNTSMKDQKDFTPVQSLEGYKVFNEVEEKKITLQVKPQIPEGSLAELDKLISEKKSELNLAINQEDRIRIYQELESLTNRKRVIEFTYKYPNKPAPLEDKPVFTVPQTKMPDKLPKQQQPIINKDAVKTNQEYIQSLTAISSIMGSITNMTNDSAAAWLSWSANLLSAVATAIPAIQAVTTAKSGEAIASGVASAAQTPIVGWLLAGAAAAAVVAALASIPSFSTGGIFDGNSTIGDMNLARVNAGEMILNNRQQRNLFNLLDGNGATGASSGGQVEFKIKGKELVGVLNNYSNKISKI